MVSVPMTRYDKGVNALGPNTDECFSCGLEVFFTISRTNVIFGDIIQTRYFNFTMVHS